MRQFQDHRQWRRFLSSRPVQGLLILLLILVGESVARLYQRERVIAVDEQSLERELLTLKARRAELLAEVARLGTDRGVEEEIRERFGVVKAGEKVINLVRGGATATPTTTPVSWWQEIVGWFK